MSVIIEFSQIQTKDVLSENKICGIFEVNFQQAVTKKACFLDSGLIDTLFSDPNSWGEVYFRPHSSQFLFYLLAIDLESNIGFRDNENENIVLAFDPKQMFTFFEQAKKYTISGKDGKFDKVLNILEEAINEEYLIITKYG